MELSLCRPQRTRAANNRPERRMFMEKMDHIKNIVCTLTGVAGATIAAAFGGWSGALTTLLIFMCLDYLMGIVVAGIFHQSPKTATGRLESRAGWKGLIRKGAILAVVLIAHRLDMLMDSASLIKDGAVIAFCTNELISIVENLSLMGVPIPKVVTNMIEKLKSEDEDIEEV